MSQNTEPPARRMLAIERFGLIGDLFLFLVGVLDGVTGYANWVVAVLIMMMAIGSAATLLLAISRRQLADLLRYRYEQQKAGAR